MQPREPLERYLRQLHDIYSTGEEMRIIALPCHNNGKIRAEDLVVTAGWGHAGQGGVTMPARGKAVERDYTDEEKAALAGNITTLGLAPEEAVACLGDSTFDIYLNDHTYWQNIPARVWSYTLGGYQVLKKWLSYREANLMGRPLKPDEVLYLSEMARRITALLLLEPALDAMYRRVTEETYAWTPNADPFKGY